MKHRGINGFKYDNVNDECLLQVFEMYRKWDKDRKIYTCKYCGAEEGEMHDRICPAWR